MKILQLFCLVLSLTPLFAICQKTDAVKAAQESNKSKPGITEVGKSAASFLVKATDARLMDSKEGAMAVKKGTTVEIRTYGELMVNDQAKMLKQIKSIAKAKKIVLPDDLSNKKEDGREDLSKETGKDFDKLFIKMMIRDHKRDIRQFSAAADLEDKEVSAFAKEYLPMIQSHLEKAEKIKK